MIGPDSSLLGMGPLSQGPISVERQQFNISESGKATDTVALAPSIWAASVAETGALNDTVGFLWPIYVNPPAATPAGGTQLITGTYSGPIAPIGFNYSIDSGAYVAATSPVISGGTFSFTIAAPFGTHTITVQNSVQLDATYTSVSFTNPALDYIQPDSSTLGFGPLSDAPISLQSNNNVYGAVIETGATTDSTDSTLIAGTAGFKWGNWQSNTSLAVTGLTVGSTSAATTNGAVAVGDLLFAVVIVKGADGASTNFGTIGLAGTWTNAYNDFNLNYYAFNIAIFWKVATLADVSTNTYAATWTGTSVTTNWALLNYGKASGSPIDVSGSNTFSAATSYTTTSITPSASNDLILHFFVAAISNNAPYGLDSSLTSRLTAEYNDAIPALFVGDKQLSGTPSVSFTDTASYSVSASAYSFGLQLGSGGTIWSTSVSETGSATDTTDVGASTWVGSLSETGAATDVLNSNTVFASNVGETGTATDTTNTTAIFASVIAETGTAADTTAVGASIWVGALAETGTASDSPNRNAIFASTISETGAAADTSVVGASTWSGVIAETGAATATPGVSGAAWATVIAETGTAADTPGVGASTWSGAISESGAATDTPGVGVSTWVGALAETGAATDSPNVGVSTWVGVVSETGTATDAVNFGGSTLSASISETGSATDTPGVGVSTWVGGLSETGAASDSPNTGASVWATAISETGSVTPTTNATAVFAASLSEAGSASDAPVVGASTWVGAISESGSVADTVSCGSGFVSSVSETGAATDTVNIGNSVWSTVISETGNATDTPSVSNSVWLGAVVETGAAADVISETDTTLGGVLESGGASDTVNTSVIFNASIVETGAASDTSSGIANYHAAITETGNTTDTLAVGPSTWGASVVEAGTATDTPAVGNSTWVGTASETGAATDAPALAGSFFAGVVAESGAIVDVSTTFVQFVGNLLETGAAIDLSMAGAQFSSATNEIGSATDVLDGGVYDTVVTVETGTVADSTSGDILFSLSATETGTLAEITDSTMIFAADVEEAGALSDSLGVTQIAYVAVDEVIGTGGSGGNALIGSIMETGNLIDIIGVSTDNFVMDMLAVLDQSDATGGTSVVMSSIAQQGPEWGGGPSAPPGTNSIVAERAHSLLKRNQTGKPKSVHVSVSIGGYGKNTDYAVSKYLDRNQIEVSHKFDPPETQEPVPLIEIDDRPLVSVEEARKTLGVRPVVKFKGKNNKDVRPTVKFDLTEKMTPIVSGVGEFDSLQVSVNFGGALELNRSNTVSRRRR